MKTFSSLRLRSRNQVEGTPLRPGGRGHTIRIPGCHGVSATHPSLRHGLELVLFPVGLSNSGLGGIVLGGVVCGIEDDAPKLRVSLSALALDVESEKSLTQPIPLRLPAHTPLQGNGVSSHAYCSWFL